MNPELQPLVDNLTEILRAGKKSGRHAFIDEQQFFLGTSKIKKALPRLPDEARPTVNPEQRETLQA
ncbi:MAG TPA: hypothetical protein VF719_12355, partial [Abditibacteriaceae bacterium]